MSGYTAEKAIVLEARLLAVAAEVVGPVCADIGTDHARLPRHLLQTGRVERAIAVEKSRGPFENARRALLGLNAEVRFGDGFSVLRPGEASSASLCGMGARRMVGILSRHPERLPQRLVLQPNDGAEPLRRWALSAGYALVREQMVEGFWRYPVLTFERGVCTAYAGLPLELALRFGPWLLRQGHPLLKTELLAQRKRLRSLPPVEWVRLELRWVEEALALLGE